MNEVANIKMTVTFDPTPEGFEAARDLIDVHEGGLADGSAAVVPSPPRPTTDPAAEYPRLDDGDIVQALYESAWKKA